jgi:hypothetical protein
MDPVITAVNASTSGKGSGPGRRAHLGEFFHHMECITIRHAFGLHQAVCPNSSFSAALARRQGHAVRQVPAGRAARPGHAPSKAIARKFQGYSLHRSLDTEETYPITERKCFKGGDADPARRRRKLPIECISIDSASARTSTHLQFGHLLPR